jgi:hypothetical protein
MVKQTNQPSLVVFEEGPLWIETVISASKDTANILQKIKEFKNFKEQNPLSPFGTGDKGFASSGIYKQYLPKAFKAHLSQDISIIYELSGRNPTKVKLYGVFTHADLGTGQPANIKIQKNMAKRLAREELEYFLKKLLLS